MNVLFVCLGNICRSPAAEAVFKEIVFKNKFESLFFVDSAGTSAFHNGEVADSRMRKAAMKRGYNITSLSRKFNCNDFERFDYILAMDESNYNDIIYLAKDNKFRAKVKMITDFSENYIFSDVPDPYYGGVEGFNKSLDIIEESCTGFLKFLVKNNEI